MGKVLKRAGLALWRKHRTHNSAKVGSIPTTCIAPRKEHLTFHCQTCIMLRSTRKTMTLTEKFKKDVQTLRGAANGDFYLDVKSPKLFKKVRRYYENEGVVFSGDPLDDYDMLIDYLVQDLEQIEVA